MSGYKKFIYSLIIIFSIFGLFIAYQIVKISTQKTKRTVSTLINQYYQLAKTKPDAAKRTLEIILGMDPNNQTAMRELGYWYLRQGDTRRALDQLLLTHKLYPDDQATNKQIDQLNAIFGKSTHYYTATKQQTSHQFVMRIDSINSAWNPFININNEQSLTLALQQYKITNKNIEISYNVNELAEQPKNVVVAHTVSQVSKRDQLLNEFYNNRLTNPKVAWRAINKLLILYPDDLIALKEAGYYALSKKEDAVAVNYFKRAYIVSHDPQLALQLGYLLDKLNEKREAYYYFDLATQATNPDERLKAELAKTNLRGVQTKFLKYPYYADILFYPFYQSRFKLIIYPIIAKVGVMLNDTYRVSLYTIYRRTSDNKSNGSGVLPQIYEDNAAITSLGLQASPIPSIPLTAFIEGGKAVDLVYKNRSRWRNDFRTGLIYYNEWGKEARYSFKPEFTFKPNMDLYGDLIYYSRYLNTIGTLRARPGVEIFRNGCTSINLYFKAFLSQDDSRLFYNNIFEAGPSIAFTPNDRYNFTIRYENLRGYYLPAGGPGKNPYSKSYHNNLVFLDMYVGL